MKLRFETARGQVAVEDLWDMPLTGKFSLDNLAKSLNRSVKEGGEESFVVKKSPKDRILDLRFSIVKRIIKVKLDDIEAKEETLTNRAKKDKILNILEDKEDESLRGMSTKDLKRLAKKL